MTIHPLDETKTCSALVRVRGDGVHVLQVGLGKRLVKSRVDAFVMVGGATHAGMDGVHASVPHIVPNTPRFCLFAGPILDVDVGAVLDAMLEVLALVVVMVELLGHPELIQSAPFSPQAGEGRHCLLM